MNKADKAAFKTGSIFGALGAIAIAPIATPVLWAALAYGNYKVARGAYNNAKLKDASQGKPDEDFFI
jgi:hypothetical protein